MAQSIQQILERVVNQSPIAPAAVVNNVQSTGKLQYYVYET